MATAKKAVAGGKVYRGSAQNGGREIVVKHYKKNGKWHTTSENAARYELRSVAAMYLPIRTLTTRTAATATTARATSRP
jgi:hypothetical protein